MIKYRRLLFFYVLLMGFNSFSKPGITRTSQDTCKFTLKGQILDAETHAPVPFATVRIKDLNRGTAANESGFFILEGLCSLELNLFISSVGYKPVTHHHDRHHDNPVIFMAPAQSELESAVIEGQAIVGDFQSMAMEQIGMNQFSSHPSKSLASMVSKLQGVNLMSAGSNVQLPVIHGLYGNRILVINRGVQHGFKAQFGLWRYYWNEPDELRTDKVLTEKDGVAVPEKGLKWINELSYRQEGHVLRMSAYNHVINNYIFDRPVAIIGTIRGPMPVFVYDQANAFFAGFDVTYTYDFTKYLAGKTGASYLWSKNIEKNEPLINQPPANIDFEVTWQPKPLLGLKSTKFTLEPSYTFRQFQAPHTINPRELISGNIDITPDSGIFDFKNPPKGYFLADASWIMEGENWVGTIALSNIFNTSYRDYLNQMRYFADELGRNLLINIKYNL